jgi:hypothetical protein
MLDERDAPVCVGSVDEEADADAAEESLDSVSRADDPRGRNGRSHRHSPHLIEQ